MSDEALKTAFQTELEALERWRTNYASAHPAVPLGREDPDVCRLIEALALFSARSRLAAEHSVIRTTRRLFRQHFDYLLSPVPAQALVQGVPSLRYNELDKLPRGSEMTLSQHVQAGTGQDETKQFRFTTQGVLDLLPLRLTDVEIRRPFRGNPQLLLELSANHEFHKPISKLSFLVNHSADFTSSLNLFDYLQRYAQSASWFVDKKPDLTGELGTSCPLCFGQLPLASASHQVLDHPLTWLRSALAYPAQLLYFHVDISIERSDWWRLYLQLELDANWPLDLDLTLDTLHLGVVPIANLVQAPATPLEVDGTRERHAVVHPEAGEGFRAHSVTGVYRFTSDGPVPLWPGVLGGQNSYEVSSEGSGSAAVTWVHPELLPWRRTLSPSGETVAIEPLLEPANLGVDAVWYQPELERLPPRGFNITLSDRHIEGVRWQLVGDVSRPRKNPLGDDAEGLLRLMALRSQRFFDAAGLRFLLTALGAQESSHFAAIVNAIDSVSFERAPSGRSPTGFKYSCRVELNPAADYSPQAVRLLQPRLLELVRSWSTEEVLSLDCVKRGGDEHRAESG